MSRRRQLTEAERQARRHADRERLEHAARALLTSDGWQRWVRVRASNGLGRYSLHNQLLIALQRPDAAYVCGFKAWIGLGYCVRRGEHAIKILAPVTVKVRDEENEDGDRRSVFFRAVSVFDRSQVDPLPDREPTPLEPPCDPLSGDSHKHLLPALAAHAATLGYRITWQAIPGSAGGWCNADAREIAIDTGLAANAKVRALVHELAHAHGIGYQRYGRERAEVIVDTVTYIMCAGAGLDVAGESVAYIAGWGEDGALEAVTEFAGVIDQIAKTLEAAITDDGPAPLEAADAPIEVPGAV